MSTFVSNRDRVFTVLLLAFLVTGASGCQSPLNPRVRMHNCEGGSCTAPVASGQQSGQTPAELFAEMNYQAIAEEQLDRAVHDAKVAKIPPGPDSLFAAFR